MKKIILLVGSSASGKTTLGKYLQTLGIPELISHTTRPIRQGEQDGVTYYYITKEEFDGLDKLESTCYSGNYYCLSRKEVENHTEDLVYCIVDTNGVKQIKNTYGSNNAIAIYVDVSYEQMKSRMKLRGDKDEDIQKRIDFALETNEKLNGYEISDYQIPDVSSKRQKELLKYFINNYIQEISYEEKTVF